MRAFACRSCGQLVFFENTTCLDCGSELGLLWPQRELLTLRAEGDRLRPLVAAPASNERPEPVGAAPPERVWRCANLELAGCNWLVGSPGELCFACELTRTRPGDADATGLANFRTAEAAKRRLLFELGELGLPIESGRRNPGGLAFDLLSSEHEAVTTGHADGLITLDLAESDDARRVARREQLGEPYRTVLGHMRHEVGHYLWSVLVGEAELARARELFGDERDDYQAALERHYGQGPPDDWSERFVSAYATMHPSEDWAETAAHYLHIRDTLQTAGAYRVRVLGPEVASPARRATELAARPTADGERDFEHLLDTWLPLTYALNALNRSMGRSDLYPFLLSPPVVEKLGFVHELVGGR